MSPRVLSRPLGPTNPIQLGAVGGVSGILKTPLLQATVLLEHRYCTNFSQRWIMPAGEETNAAIILYNKDMLLVLIPNPPMCDVVPTLLVVVSYRNIRLRILQGNNTSCDYDIWRGDAMKEFNLACFHDIKAGRLRPGIRIQRAPSKCESEDYSKDTLCQIISRAHTRRKYDVFLDTPCLRYVTPPPFSSMVWERGTAIRQAPVVRPIPNGVTVQSVTIGNDRSSGAKFYWGVLPQALPSLKPDQTLLCLIRRGIHSSARMMECIPDGFVTSSLQLVNRIPVLPSLARAPLRSARPTHATTPLAVTEMGKDILCYVGYSVFSSTTKGPFRFTNQQLVYLLLDLLAHTSGSGCECVMRCADPPSGFFRMDQRVHFQVRDRFRQVVSARRGLPLEYSVDLRAATDGGHTILSLLNVISTLRVARGHSTSHTGDMLVRADHHLPEATVYTAVSESSSKYGIVYISSQLDVPPAGGTMLGHPPSEFVSNEQVAEEWT